MNLFDITGKKVVFTGAGGGLGKGMVEAILDAGGEVAILDIRPELPGVVEEFKAKGYKAHGVKCDLNDREDLKKSFAEALALLGGEIDALFNVAGVQRRHKSEEFPIEDWDFVLNVNLTAPFMLCQLAAREMIKRGKGGKIINISSLLGFFGGYTVPAYSASKGAISQITKAFCNEWARYGINVNAIAPGYMDTEMNVALVNDEGRNSEILARIPTGRWGTPKDMQGIGIFLMSEASNYVNGAVILVDGGYMAR